MCVLCLCVSVCVCVVFVCLGRERDRETQRDRERQRETERQLFLAILAALDTAWMLLNYWPVQHDEEQVQRCIPA